jgi:hypothetical protein
MMGVLARWGCDKPLRQLPQLRPCRPREGRLGAILEVAASTDRELRVVRSNLLPKAQGRACARDPVRGVQFG